MPNPPPSPSPTFHHSLEDAIKTIIQIGTPNAEQLASAAPACLLSAAHACAVFSTNFDNDLPKISRTAPRVTLEALDRGLYININFINTFDGKLGLRLI